MDLDIAIDKKTHPIIKSTPPNGVIMPHLVLLVRQRI